MLLVEDEEKLSQLLKNAIGDSFYKFSVAHDGEEGLELFEKIEPDIVITDIMMPKITGLEMAKKIKAIDRNVPIIILSAFSDTEKFLDAIDVGVVKYFIKPFDPDELLDYIKSLEGFFGERSLSLHGEFTYNKSKRTLYKKGRYIALTKKEKEFLQLLIENHSEGVLIVDDAKIKELLWDSDATDARLRTFVRRLREKTSKDLVKNVKGEGYQIVVA
ncbi:response regulator transcription factor [Sulfurimonas paralvinellae]|uniref:Response regulator transcription factor n=1 Tax=Sulfurimonas paralvinellae TaxID=317658 RepID=A0A7M1BB63_9BACT|nr:response regulator transcription factor [Sulfurimonas paralvinellae]